MLFRLISPILVLSLAVAQPADIPSQRLQTTTVGEVSHPAYRWASVPVGETAQLLTLICVRCQNGTESQQDQPLVSVLRDTLGDDNPENDRVTDVWLLTYSHLSVGQRALSAVPFFYWRIGQGSQSVSAHDTAPLFDMTAPQHPVMSEFGRDLFQWTFLDPVTMSVRASSRAYRTNQIDYERLHLEEAISYLRGAPVSDDTNALTQTQLDTVIARLELRKHLLGGLVPDSKAAHFGEEAAFQQERIRSRNWEMLRQCADRTGLLFEPLNLTGGNGDYAMLWFPLNTPQPAAASSLGPVWKLLNIHDPWTDPRLKNWDGPVYTRTMNDNGGRSIQVAPLGVYSLNYPKLPLLLVDFRDKLHVRWHEMTQRSINEITAGVIGISHFTNWYYYVGADLYDFVVDRHGAAMNQAARLDCYSQFRVALALDDQVDPQLRKEMQRRADSLAVNPMEATPAHEMEAAQLRYARLTDEAHDGQMLALLEKQRRAELAYFEASDKQRVKAELLHASTLGRYTDRAKPDASNLTTLECYRRAEYQLQFLDGAVASGTQPEVAYDRKRIQASVAELTNVMPRITSAGMRTHAEATLERVKNLSRDEDLQADCSTALASLKHNAGAIAAAGVTASLDIAH